MCQPNMVEKATNKWQPAKRPPKLLATEKNNFLTVRNAENAKIFTNLGVLGVLDGYRNVSKKMHLIVGLGNPGAEYSRTRHNIGWMILDELARRHELRIEKKNHDARIGGGAISGHRVLLAKPQTYMNLSGKSVSAMMNFYRIEPSKLLVLCDDINLPIAKLRLRKSGSDGGQNGLKSVAQMIGTREYARLRFGIGMPPEAERLERGTAAYVLRPFTAEENPLVQSGIERACKCIETFVAGGVLEAMNQFNAAE